ncbi:Na+/H+ antiporter family protein [Buchananella hordeovulneris]|uniref:Na+/H+ antiporter family protein n=1 Tax=Buchananella hordeovulneris TaxID=52770 RepID=UPI0026DABA31|nr:Na+/H+ antiporter NhaC family protein [Buchananella hordeovulneris]MDO5081592.1 Na+/H+ antiporter NhaC family protein [Buchananella hordeovulneris]
MNAVVVAVLVMLVLSLVRVNVVLSLFVGAMTGGLLAGLGLDQTLVAFEQGLGNGAKLALSYALLGAFAMAVAHSGLPALLAHWLVSHLRGPQASAGRWVRWGLIGGVLAMAIMSQNLIPVHIAFIPLLIPPLLTVMDKLQLDRRLLACVMTFGLVTTYMYLPVGFGRIYLEDILLGQISRQGLDVSGVNVLLAMGLPALGMLVGLLVAVFVTYRAPVDYSVVAARGAAGARAGGAPNDTASRQGEGTSGAAESTPAAPPAPRLSRYKIAVSVAAILASFVLQTVMTLQNSQANPMLISSLIGLVLFVATGVVRWTEADAVFSGGMRMMAMIGLIMIAAQGFAEVMNRTGHIEPLVQTAVSAFGNSRALAALSMLVVGLIVTMGIGSSFSTLPIIVAIYVPLCVELGFSPLATVALVGTAGALGDAGSPASDSTLGPTAGLNVDGKHDHMRGTVIPTFLHFNLPLLAAGWLATLVL